jgi:hypothetical protein
MVEGCLQPETKLQRGSFDSIDAPPIHTHTLFCLSDLLKLLSMGQTQLEARSHRSPDDLVHTHSVLVENREEKGGKPS